MPLLAAAAFALILLLVILGFFVVTTYNDVVALVRRCDKAWANIDVALKQRHDELPNLVGAVRGVMGFEEDVLTRLTQLRAQYNAFLTVAEHGALSAETTQAIRSLFAVVENYPDLKSQGNVAALQTEVERLEGIIADRRELYNDQVYRYDARIAQVPAAWLAGAFSWQAREYFAASEGDRARPDARLRPA